MPGKSVLTLSIDCGGGGVKASVIDSAARPVTEPIRTPTPYPLPPRLLVGLFKQLAKRLPQADRVTVGMPGMLRDGRVIATPHYVTKDGPRSKVLPGLVALWDNFDMESAVNLALGLPALVLNDAEVAGAGTVKAEGLEMIITLGTGLGNAVFLEGHLTPHAEISQGYIRWGLTYDDYIGEHERLRLGDAHWSRRVRRVVEGLQPMYLWDKLYIGGGNAKRIVSAQRLKLPENVSYVSNDAGMLGGVRAWDLVRPETVLPSDFVEVPPEPSDRDVDDL